MTERHYVSLSVTKPKSDPEEIERQQRRLRAEQINSHLRYSIEQSLARRVRVERVKA